MVIPKITSQITRKTKAVSILFLSIRSFFQKSIYDINLFNYTLLCLIKRSNPAIQAARNIRYSGFIHVRGNSCVVFEITGLSIVVVTHVDAVGVGLVFVVGGGVIIDVLVGALNTRRDELLSGTGVVNSFNASAQSRIITAFSEIALTIIIV
jgi:hypothetical protein